MAETILVTGATGYIGSHTCVCLLKAGWRVVAVDNLSNSSMRTVDRIQTLCRQKLPFHLIDVRDESALMRLLSQENISAAIHFAGLKSVTESISKPLDYYDNNVNGSITLLKVLHRHGVRKLVFSSSATVYGDPKQVPISENASLSATNPYGRSKLFIEQIVNDLSEADAEWRIATLRYFNPAGAHESGLLGEDPRGQPNNLMPYIAQVAVGKLPHLSVFGNDYPTSDGTGVRDYIHVMDLAQGHLSALSRLYSRPGSFTVNLGTGQGVTVLQAVAAFEKACGATIPITVAPRRAGDIATCYASANKAKELLNWTAEKTLLQMVNDHWRWQKQNPNGY